MTGINSEMRQKIINDLFSGLQADIPSAARKLKVSQVEYDSRKVQNGALFVAVPGFAVDGHKFVATAERQGAAAAVVQTIVPGVKIPQIVVPESRAALARLAYNFYSPEIGEIHVLGITGTNGKTTSAFLLRSILQAAGRPCGLIGTVRYEFAGKKLPAHNTTPEAADICRMLFEMHQNGYRDCVLEVSSHALSLKRVEALSFKVGLFTNLSRDHMDFYRSEEEYFAAKAHLFDLLHKDGSAIVNLDDAHGMRLNDMLSVRKVSYGFSEKADIYPLKWDVQLSGIDLQCITPGGEMAVHSPLTGFFNLYNLLGVIGAAHALNLPAEAIRRGIEEVQAVPGRMQSFKLPNGATVFIDYAHTPDALQKALQTLRNVTKKRLIVLFGAGGDRDHGKRPLMGQAAAGLADWSVVTSDNPRSEDPQAIIQDIIAGMQETQNRQIIVDRREAIFEAVRMLKSGDVLLIAGKGHEDYQVIQGKKYPFDEVKMVHEAAADV